MRNRVFRESLASIAFVMIALAMAMCASAAISGGPKSTNAVVAAQNHNIQFYEAEKSNEEKLKVGKQRYDQKQINRAKIIAAMSAELQARQQTVVIEPVAAHDSIAEEMIVSWFRPSLVVAVMAACCVGYAFHLIRRKPKSRAPLQPGEIPAVMDSRPVRSRYRITALKPVTIWANVEVSKTERTPLGAKVNRTSNELAWIRLEAGEMRDKLSLVLGIHPDCVPNGKRVHLTGANAEIVPLGAWTDRELPKNFFEFFKLEVSESKGDSFSSRN
jgi:hypothetical protein